MVNMSYCRFENTFRALNECLEDGEITEESSESEKMYYVMLLHLCREYLEIHGLEEKTTWNQ